MLEAYLAALAAVLGLMTVLWLLSLRLEDASIVDIAWGPVFVLSAWIYAFFGPLTLEAPFEQPWRLLPLVLVTLWGTRLALHIGWRHDGEDRRYRAMREKRGESFRWWSLPGVFWLQGVLASVIGLPLLFALLAPRPEQVTLFDVAGLVLWLVGFFFEAVGDWQLSRFKADPENRGQVLSSGLWRYTRHPNYFGDACQWWGFGLLACATGEPLYVAGSLASAALMTLFLLKISGVALLEKDISDRRPAYRDYVERTPAFFPWWPKRESS